MAKLRMLRRDDSRFGAPFTPLQFKHKTHIAARWLPKTSLDVTLQQLLAQKGFCLGARLGLVGVVERGAEVG